MAARSNSSTTSLMNSARSPSGSHCRMSGGSSNCWSSVYGRNAFVMANTLATAPPRGHSLFSDTLLVVENHVHIERRRHGRLDRVEEPAEFHRELVPPGKADSRRTS